MDNKAVILRIISNLKPYKKSFCAVALLMAASLVMGFFEPLVIRKMTDDGMFSHNYLVLYGSAAILFLLVILNQAAEMAQKKLFISIHNRCFYALFHQTFCHLIRLKKSYFEDKNNSEILGCIQTDVSQVASITDRYTAVSVSYAFRIVSGLIGLLIISWKLTLIVLAMVPLKLLLVQFLSKRREKAMTQLVENNRDFSRWFGDNLEGIDEIKLWCLFKKKDIEFQSRQKVLLQLEQENSMIEAWNDLWETLLEWCVTIILYLVGGILVCQNNLSIGSVFAFVSYSCYVTGPVSAFLNLRMYFASILPSARRLYKFLAMEAEEPTGINRIDSHELYLEFKEVEFSYQMNRPILRGVSFHIGPGEKVAIIGQNGSGKSTIINLLLRFYTPNSGEIIANGLPVSQLPLDEYRSLFAVVSQEPYLFLGNIADNVDLTGQTPSDKFTAAIESSGVADFIQRMSDRENTQIGRNGARLSGGEKQKLAVARALLKDAPIIILDEATSGFDKESDAYLHDIIVGQMSNKSVIMITHRYDNLIGMDRIYRLDDGKLFECTTQN